MSGDLLITIDELVGPAAGVDRDALAAAVAAHLERLLGPDDAFPLPLELPADSGTIRVATTATVGRLDDPALLAGEVARAIAAGLGVTESGRGRR